jgi:dTDP-4-amino-4,6-dideoxygalactose transaminase
MDALTAIAAKHNLHIIEDCAHSPGKMWRGRGVGSFGAFGSFSHQSSKILTAGEGGTLLTDDESLAQRAHSIIDCGRPKDPAGQQYNFGCNYRLGELHAALLCGQLEKFDAQMRERAENARYFMERLKELNGVRALHLDERVTRLSFYRFIVAINPEAFGGVSNSVVCDALDAEGIGCWVGYDPMNKYPLFQPKLSRMPVAVAYADRLDPSKWSLPVAERAAHAEQIYLDEAMFRAGRSGIDDLIEAFAKLQRNPDALRKAASM